MTRVYVDIVGDLFHIGHLNLFKKAKALYDNSSLIVGVHSDLDAAKYKRTPIIQEDQRYESVSSCKIVDELIKNAPLLITTEFISEHQIDYVVHGNDITEEINRQHKIPSQMGIVRYVECTEGISTTEIINKVAKSILQ